MTRWKIIYLEIYKGAFNMDLYTIRRELMSGKTIYDLPLRVTYYSRVSTEKDEQKTR